LKITEIISIFKRVSKKLNDVVMTTAQQLINQGINQGYEIKEIEFIKKGYENGISNDLLVNISFRACQCKK
jgi:hypothetical protein